jgi:Putative adhesin
MTNWDFACSDPIDISIDNWTAGTIALSGESTSVVTVEVVPSRHRADVDELLDQVQVAFEDGQLYIHGPRVSTFRRRHGLDLTIKAPSGSSCAAKTVSSDLTCVGNVSAVTLHTASGDLSAAAVAGDVHVRSASGDVMLDAVGGSLTVHTASGDVQVGRVGGEIRVNSASGDVSIGSCTGSAAVHTASGDIKLAAVSAGRIELASASGDLAVAVVPGIEVYLDLSSNSGDIGSELDASDGDGQQDSGAVAVELRCRTLSGDIRITKAHGVPSQPALQS